MQSIASARILLQFHSDAALWSSKVSTKHFCGNAVQQNGTIVLHQIKKEAGQNFQTSIFSRSCCRLNNIYWRSLATRIAHYKVLNTFSWSRVLVLHNIQMLACHFLLPATHGSSKCLSWQRVSRSESYISNHSLARWSIMSQIVTTWTLLPLWSRRYESINLFSFLRLHSVI